MRVVESVNDLAPRPGVEWSNEKAERGAWVLSASLVFAGANLVFQVVALALALVALAQGHDSAPPMLLVVAEPASVLLLLLIGILTAWLRFLGPRKSPKP